MIWTDAKIAELRALHAEGLSFSKIGEFFGVTRSAISGKVDRLGMCARKPEERAPRTVKPGTKPRRERRAKTAEPRTTKPARTTPFRAVSDVAPDVPLPEFDPSARTERACGLLDLTEDRCRWPVGDVGTPGFFFCGETVETAKPYCAGHCRRAYTFSRMPADGMSDEHRAALARALRKTHSRHYGAAA